MSGEQQIYKRASSFQQFIQTPVQLYDERCSLTNIEKIVYEIYGRFADWHDYTCFPTVETVAKLAHISERYLQKINQDLINKGYIRRLPYYDPETGRQKASITELIHPLDTLDFREGELEDRGEGELQDRGEGELEDTLTIIRYNYNQIELNEEEEEEEEELQPEDFTKPENQIAAADEQETIVDGSVLKEGNLQEDIDEFSKYTAVKMSGNAARDTYSKWRFEWEFSHQVIMKAGQLMSQLAKVPNLNYVDRILSDWKKRHVRTVSEAEQAIELFRAEQKDEKPSSKGRRKTPKANICETTQREYKIYVPP